MFMPSVNLDVIKLEEFYELCFPQTDAVVENIKVQLCTQYLSQMNPG